MSTAETFDLESIEEIENVWIPLPDGCRLAARLWLPKSARMDPVPVILEYIPYRKRDFMRSRDEPIHRYHALHGYAAIRVDVRGSGDSDGILEDEYTASELADAIAVIDWLSQQDWCDGNVGMTGISWGGFNSLQVAALRPAALKAVITLCSTDDRYSDDAHYMGGCLLNENMQWGSILMLYTALPPDPDIVGESWRETWKQRLDALNPFPAVWMDHQTRDGFWQHGSVCEDWSAIQCPVYAVGGWADGYTNAIPRLLENLRGPKKRFDWAMGALLSSRWHARTFYWLDARVAAVVGSLAQGARHRNYGRTCITGVDAGERSASAAIRGMAWALGGGTRLAKPKHKNANVGVESWPPQP